MVGLKTHCKAVPGRPPRQGRHPPLRPPRHRQLQPDHRADLHRPQLLHLPARVRRGRQRPVQPADRLLAGPRLEEADRRPDEPGRPPDRPDRPRAAERRGRQAGADHRQDELAGRPPRHRRPGRRQPRRGPDRPDRPGDLLPPPGHAGVSENIRVISIVDKFLEHSRISYFQNDDDPEVFLSSADWMPRNFRRRVEILFPIEDPRLQNRIVDGILGVALIDNVKARDLQPDGTYRRVAPAQARRALDPLAGRVPEPGPRALRRRPDPSQSGQAGIEPPVPGQRGLIGSRWIASRPTRGFRESLRKLTRFSRFDLSLDSPIFISRTF